MRVRRELLFIRFQARTSRLRNPQTMTQKVNWRILNDRRPLLAWTCDKLKMKEHARQACGTVRIPKTLWVGTDVSELADMALPEYWVLKPNHRTALVHFGRGAVVNVDELRKETEHWLDDEQSVELGEWAYAQADKLLLVEEGLGSPERLPNDYKFYIFDGLTKFIQVDQCRFSSEQSRQLYSRDWEPLALFLKMAPAGFQAPPVQLNEMLDIAEAIAKPFDFMRVDLYNIDGEIYFGEVTPYPSSALDRYPSRKLDREVGACWKLPDLSTM